MSLRTNSIRPLFVCNSTINLSNQADGMYYIRFLNKDGVTIHSQSILIQH